MFAPDLVAVRFEDDAGQYWEIIISSCFQHTEEQYNRERAKAVERLNEIFHSLGLLEGQWVDKDMYSTHENVAYNMKKVPIWEKYALSLSEAAEYFHIGTRRLRQIIAKDKYAKYLIWNGGRVFFKRKMFEEYLNNEVQLFSNNNTES